MSREKYTDFGVITTTAATAVAFPNGVDAGDGGNIGRICDLFVHVAVEGSKAVPAAEGITFTVKDGDTTGAGTAIATIVRPKGALAVGEKYVFRLPMEHKRYISLEATADTTAGISLRAWLEEGEGR